jgi:serine protease SohB
MNVLIQLGIFAAELMLVLIFILSLLSGILSLISKNKSQQQGKIIIKNLNEKFDNIKLDMQKIILNKSDFKKMLKKSKKLKKDKSTHKTQLFVLTFRGDIKASDVSALREEISAILGIADTTDEVVVCLDSPGGLVHAYGLAASQLARLRDRGIPLTVCVDKVAASGGYLMACVANKILAAPFCDYWVYWLFVAITKFTSMAEKK